jgi:hypothetical protein
MYLEIVYNALGYEPPESPTSDGQLRRIEDKLGRSLPAAVREWYSREHAVELMRSHTSDSPVTLGDLGEVSNAWYGDAPRDFLADGFLFVMAENQGVVNWFVDLASGDDPQVFVEDRRSPDAEWRLHSQHFSEWVYTVFIDWVPHNAPALIAQDVALAAADLTWLRETMEPGPVTYTWPCPVNYRFRDRDQYLLIWACESQADWSLYAGSEWSLSNLANRLWKLGTLSQSLFSTDDAGERVLEYVRGVR